VGNCGSDDARLATSRLANRFIPIAHRGGQAASYSWPSVPDARKERAIGTPDETFLDALKHGMKQLFLSLDTLDPKTDPYYVPIFLIACWLLGVAVVFFDLALRHNSGKSVTGSETSFHERLLMLLSWPFGAAFF
jgi:hypothetical protein